MKEKKFFRNCTKCEKQIGHTTEKARNISVNLDTLCNSCSKKGKPKSAQHAANISASKTGKTRKPFSDEHKARMGAGQRAYKKLVRDAYTEMYGDKYKFAGFYFSDWSKQVKERDNYTCQKCAKVAEGNFINAHHIVPKCYFMARALDIDNGCTLCTGCHQQVHGELDTYVLKGVKFSATDFQNHLIGFITNGKK